MNLINISERAPILEAIAEFDRLGREQFLAKYGFRPSRRYWLEHDGRKYDSKAIIGAAHGYVVGQDRPLRSGEFSGGEKAVVAILKRLGFQVTSAPPVPEFIPYVVGKIYHRQRDIHQRFGGQERGGIATPQDSQFVFLFTGESGETFGYRDGWQLDGTFYYAGEGQLGDMQFVRGNRAIRDHRGDGTDLLLFQAEKEKGKYRFIGCFICDGWHNIQTPDRSGQEREGIVFHLIPVAGLEFDDFSSAIADEIVRPKDLTVLRQKAYEAASVGPRPPTERSRNHYERSNDVKAYVLARSNGVCECCGLPAPFKRRDGTPYLEPHHTLRVSDGGPDSPAQVAAICPTCHRRIHHGQGGEELNQELKTRLRLIERN